MSPTHKPVFWLRTQVKSPPLSDDARRRAGELLRCVQAGVRLEMPESRPMPTIGTRVHELRISDAVANQEWRLIYRIDDDVIIVADVFQKRTQKTPKAVIDLCVKRLSEYDRS